MNEVTLELLKEWFSDCDFTGINNDQLLELNQSLDDARMEVFEHWAKEHGYQLN